MSGSESTPQDSRDKVRQVLQGLTLEEKAGILSGWGFWESGGVPRLGLAPLGLTDGPHGARGLSTRGDPGALLSPCEMALAATFNEAIIEEVGVVLGLETRRRGADVLLGPTINLQRFPQSGRHFECFSEDPYLTSRASIAYVKGVQKHALACLKHFVCNDQETDRHSANSVVDEQTLREVYLAPFEATVREAKPASLMCGYNKLNGSYCTESTWLLKKVLREEWGFQGLVMSDWFGNNGLETAVEAGLDVEMPGLEPRFYGHHLVDAVNDGRIQASVVDERCLPVLEALLRPGRTDPRPGPPSSDEKFLLRRAATEACVLMRNEKPRKGSTSTLALPLTASQLKRIAVIGPNAEGTCIQGGGSSRVNVNRSETILEALKKSLEPKGVTVEHAKGASWETAGWKNMNPEAVALFLVGACDKAGQPRGRLMRSVSFINDTVVATVAWFSKLGWFARIVGRWASATKKSTLAAQQAEGAGDRRGNALLGQAGQQEATQAMMAAMPSNASMSSNMSVRQSVNQSARDEKLLTDAEAAAAAADACVLVVGTHGFWELEGVDQPHMGLGGRQDELISRVADAAKGPVVVVLNVGSPKEMPWLPQADAVVLAHFGGQEMAAAVVDVLLGQANPAGRLPTTWPQRLESAPATVALQKKLQERASAGEAPPKKGDVLYAEERYIGYRASHSVEDVPLFPFGHGLSYTTFTYGAMEVKQTESCAAADGPRVRVSLTVSNAGSRPGAEVVQLYVEAGPNPRSLCGFRRSAQLDLGAKEVVTFEVGARGLGAFFSTEKGQWEQPQPKSKVVLMVGGSSAETRARAEVVLK